MPIKLNGYQRELLEKAILKLDGKKGILKNNERVQAFVAERRSIDTATDKKNPVVKEYINLFKDAETKSYTFIGRVAKEMKKVAAEQEALKMAADMCKDEADKNGLLDACKELDNHPAMSAYGKYMKGLRYLSGLDEKVEKNISEFFQDELRIVLEADGEYNSWRKLEEVATDENEKMKQEYQKLVAPAKAKEIFSKKSILVYSALLKDFTGISVMEEGKGLFTGRMTPTAFCIGQMLHQGYSLEEVLDPRARVKEKRAIGAEYMKRREGQDLKWYTEGMYNAGEAYINALNKYLKDNKENLKTDHDLTMHTCNLGMVGFLSHDLLQELNRLAKDKECCKYKSSKDLSNMAEAVGGYSIAAGTGSTNKIPYELDDISVEELAGEVRRQMQIKLFLEELQKDEPNYKNAFVQPEHLGGIDQQIVCMKEFNDIYEKTFPDMADDNNYNIDMENLNSKKIKILASAMSQEFVQSKKIGYQAARLPVTVKEKPKYNLGDFINKGKKINGVVTIDGKQLISTNISASLDQSFRNFEKKNLRGKESSNSKEFNALLKTYDEAMDKLSANTTPNKECLKEMEKLREAAMDYLTAKREQKGYQVQRGVNAQLDETMLGRGVGDSIFTSRGKDRYEFALNMIKESRKIESEILKFEAQNPVVKEELENEPMEMEK